MAKLSKKGWIILFSVMGGIIIMGLLVAMSGDSEPTPVPEPEAITEPA
jgi:hypothetical protein